MSNTKDRREEWFVPPFGPLKSRIFIGLLFLPYTGMVLSYTVMGAVLAEVFHPGRAGGLVFVYFLALGIAAHTLDALGSRVDKPWGTHFRPAQLWGLTITSLLPAATIGVFFALSYAPPTMASRAAGVLLPFCLQPGVV